MVIQLLANAALAVLFAPECAACHSPLETPLSGCVCPCCWQSILPITPPLCERCGDPMASTARICSRCRRLPGRIDAVRAVGVYDGTLRAIVHAFKYDGRRSLARPLAALMRMRGRDLIEGADLAVPVPLHRSRRRERGFDQASDLARHIGLPVVAALKRTRATAIQATLPAAKRHGNVRDAFAIARIGTSIAGRRILLIDDVATTGATLDACASVLRACGAARVYGLTAARVATRPP